MLSKKENPMINNWSELKFFHTGEFQVIDERLNECPPWCPGPHALFKSLDLSFADTKVVLMGQDPYPNPRYATGLAYNIPDNISDWPPTLINIIREYKSDLHYPHPKTGSLEKWSKEGVLLWNCIPSCEIGKPLSHDWEEWKPLTEEIVRLLDARGGVVFVMTGAKSREYTKYISQSPIIETSHPSPRGSLAGNHPFLGSRIFSRTNALLTSIGVKPIDWKLN